MHPKIVQTTAVLLRISSTVEAAQTVTGKSTKVRDADSVVVNGVPVRLNGVDAPENGTKAGNAATAAMKRFVRGKTLTANSKASARMTDGWAFATQKTAKTSAQL